MSERTEGGMGEGQQLPDRCLGCGRFVGRYPIGFYDDRFCASCYDARHPEVGDYSVVLPGTVEIRHARSRGCHRTSRCAVKGRSS